MTPPLRQGTPITPPTTMPHRAAQPGVDRLLLRKVVQANELLAIGETAAAHAMLAHVLDVAEAQNALPGAVYATALRLFEQTAR